MKLKGILIVAVGLLSMSIMAQENKTVKKETTVKKVVTKQGSKVVTKEVAKVKKEKGKILVEGNQKVDQSSGEAVNMDQDQKVVSDAVTLDMENEAKKKAMEEKRKRELQEAIEAQKAKAEEQKKLLEEQRQERMRLLEENRKKLQHRPKGMSKLKKDN